ncbi:hypothetical protein HZS_4695 [Henneguya salminicola]|nr:hypothetical protein HZS_4695 [Henneguya salminicola]
MSSGKDSYEDSDLDSLPDLGNMPSDQKLPLNPFNDEKKRVHNELERKRRGNIKENFDMLFQVVPVEDHEKSSRSQILHSTVKHITHMNKVIEASKIFKQKCQDDVRDFQEELKRLEKCRAEGQPAIINPDIFKRVEEAKLSVVPDMNTVPRDISTSPSVSDSLSEQGTPKNSIGSRASSNAERPKLKRGQRIHQENRTFSVNSNKNDFESGARNLTSLLQNVKMIHPNPQPKVEQLQPTLVYNNPLPVNLAGNEQYPQNYSTYGAVCMDHNYEGKFYPQDGPNIKNASNSTVPSMIPISTPLHPIHSSSFHDLAHNIKPAKNRDKKSSSPEEA